jgi:hypothetical protein
MLEPELVKLEQHQRAASRFLPQHKRVVAEKHYAVLRQQLVTFHTKPVKRALLCGSNYPRTPYELKGCLNDVATMTTLLRSYGYTNFNVLTDKTAVRPTARNILAAFTQLLQSSKAGDTLFFHYSGHGSFEQGAYEQDDLFIGCDLVSIKDDVLKNTIRAHLKPNTRLFAVFDNCFSGTQFDLRYNCLSTDAQPNVDATKDETRAGVYTFSGCSDAQTSADTFLNGKYCGAMTHVFHQVFAPKKAVTFRDSLLQMRKTLAAKGFTQVPQLQSGLPLDLDSVVNF